jgi:hypothetical protein
MARLADPDVQARANPQKNAGIVPALSPLEQLGRMAGELLDTALTPVHALAQLTGEGLKALGGATSNQDLINAGSVIVQGDRESHQVIAEHPIETVAVLAGGALAVTGVATGAGAALVGAGLRGLSVEQMGRGGEAQAQGEAGAAPASTAPAGAQEHPSTPGGFARFWDWFVHSFLGMKR